MGIYQDRDIFDILGELQHRFTHHGGKIEGNILERYYYFILHSEFGKRCSFAARSKDLFVKYDYDVVKRLILEAAEKIKESDPDTDWRKIPYDPPATPIHDPAEDDNEN